MTDFPAFSKKEYETLANFRYALLHFLRFSKHAIESAGITLQQHQALLFIIGYPGKEQITIGDLAERLQIRHQSAVGLVNRLEEQELVERKQGVEDKRQVLIVLTKKGTNLLESLVNMHREELRQLGPELGNMLEQIAHYSNDSK